MLNKKGKYISKTVAVLVSVIFLWDTVLWSAPFQATSDIQTIKKGQLTDLSIPALSRELEIPESLGSVQMRHHLEDGDMSPTIVHIQDAHANQDAQTSALEILKLLEREHDLDLMFVEGAFGEMKPALFQIFKSKEANRSVWQRLLHIGLVGAPELFLLAQSERPDNSRIQAFGVEDPDLYRENLRSFRRVAGAKEVWDGYLESIKRGVFSATSKVFSKELKHFFRNWLFYQDAPSTLTSHLKVLRESARKHLNLDLLSPHEQKAWPQLVRIFALEKLEQKLDQQEITKDEIAASEWLAANGYDANSVPCISNLTQDCYDNMLASNDVKTLRRYVERFLYRSQAKGFSFETYPAWRDKVGYQIVQSEINATNLFREIDQLTDLILELLATTEAEKELVSLYKDYLVLHQLLSLEISYEQFAGLKAREAELRPSQILERLATVDKKMADQLRAKKTADAFDLFYDEALSFYEGARKRERAIANNMIATMKELKKPNAVLVTGGFHTRGLSELAKANDFSFVSIAPHISELGSRNTYLDSIMLRGNVLAPLSTLRSTSFGTPLREWATRAAVREDANTRAVQLLNAAHAVHVELNLPNHADLMTQLSTGGFLKTGLSFAQVPSTGNILTLAGTAVTVGERKELVALVNDKLSLLNPTIIDITVPTVLSKSPNFSVNLTATKSAPTLPQATSEPKWWQSQYSLKTLIMLVTGLAFEFGGITAMQNSDEAFLVGSATAIVAVGTLIIVGASLFLGAVMLTTLYILDRGLDTLIHLRRQPVAAKEAPTATFPSPSSLDRTLHTESIPVSTGARAETRPARDDGAFDDRKLIPGSRTGWLALAALALALISFVMNINLWLNQSARDHAPPTVIIERVVVQPADEAVPPAHSTFLSGNAQDAATILSGQEPSTEPKKEAGPQETTPDPSIVSEPQTTWLELLEEMSIEDRFKVYGDTPRDVLVEKFLNDPRSEQLNFPKRLFEQNMHLDPEQYPLHPHMIWYTRQVMELLGQPTDDPNSLYPRDFYFKMIAPMLTLSGKRGNDAAPVSSHTANNPKGGAQAVDTVPSYRFVKELWSAVKKYRDGRDSYFPITLRSGEVRDARIGFLDGIVENYLTPDEWRNVEAHWQSYRQEKYPNLSAQRVLARAFAYLQYQIWETYNHEIDPQSKRFRHLRPKHGFEFVQDRKQFMFSYGLTDEARKLIDGERPDWIRVRYKTFYNEPSISSMFMPFYHNRSPFIAMYQSYVNSVLSEIRKAGVGVGLTFPVTPSNGRAEELDNWWIDKMVDKGFKNPTHARIRPIYGMVTQELLALRFAEATLQRPNLWRDPKLGFSHVFDTGIARTIARDFRTVWASEVPYELIRPDLGNWLVDDYMRLYVNGQDWGGGYSQAYDAIPPIFFPGSSGGWLFSPPEYLRTMEVKKVWNNRYDRLASELGNRFPNIGEDYQEILQYPLLRYLNNHRKDIDNLDIWASQVMLDIYINIVFVTLDEAYRMGMTDPEEIIEFMKQKIALRPAVTHFYGRPLRILASTNNYEDAGLVTAHAVETFVNRTEKIDWIVWELLLVITQKGRDLEAGTPSEVEREIINIMQLVSGKKFGLDLRKPEHVGTVLSWAASIDSTTAKKIQSLVTNPRLAQVLKAFNLENEFTGSRQVTVADLRKQDLATMGYFLGYLTAIAQHEDVFNDDGSIDNKKWNKYISRVLQDSTDILDKLRQDPKKEKAPDGSRPEVRKFNLGKFFGLTGNKNRRNRTATFEILEPRQMLASDVSEPLPPFEPPQVDLIKTNAPRTEPADQEQDAFDPDAVETGFVEAAHDGLFEALGTGEEEPARSQPARPLKNELAEILAKEAAGTGSIANRAFGVAPVAASAVGPIVSPIPSAPTANVVLPTVAQEPVSVLSQSQTLQDAIPATVGENTVKVDYYTQDTGDQVLHIFRFTLRNENELPQDLGAFTITAPAGSEPLKIYADDNGAIRDATTEAKLYDLNDRVKAFQAGLSLEDETAIIDEQGGVIVRPISGTVQTGLPAELSSKSVISSTTGLGFGAPGVGLGQADPCGPQVPGGPGPPPGATPCPLKGFLGARPSPAPPADGLYSQGKLRWTPKEKEVPATDITSMGSVLFDRGQFGDYVVAVDYYFRKTADGLAHEFRVRVTGQDQVEHQMDPIIVRTEEASQVSLIFKQLEELTDKRLHDLKAEELTHARIREFLEISIYELLLKNLEEKNQGDQVRIKTILNALLQQTQVEKPLSGLNPETLDSEATNSVVPAELVQQALQGELHITQPATQDTPGAFEITAADGGVRFFSYAVHATRDNYQFTIAELDGKSGNATNLITVTYSVENGVATPASFHAQGLDFDILGAAPSAQLEFLRDLLEIGGRGIIEIPVDIGIESMFSDVFSQTTVELPLNTRGSAVESPRPCVKSVISSNAVALHSVKCGFNQTLSVHEPAILQASTGFSPSQLHSKSVKPYLKPSFTITPLGSYQVEVADSMIIADHYQLNQGENRVSDIIRIFWRKEDGNVTLLAQTRFKKELQKQGAQAEHMELIVTLQKAASDGTLISQLQSQIDQGSSQLNAQELLKQLILQLKFELTINAERQLTSLDQQGLQVERMNPRAPLKLAQAVLEGEFEVTRFAARDKPGAFQVTDSNGTTRYFEYSAHLDDGSYQFVLAELDGPDGHITNAVTVTYAIQDGVARPATFSSQGLDFDISGAAPSTRLKFFDDLLTIGGRGEIEVPKEIKGNFKTIEPILDALREGDAATTQTSKAEKPTIVDATAAAEETTQENVATSGNVAQEAEFTIHLTDGAREVVEPAEDVDYLEGVFDHLVDENGRGAEVVDALFSDEVEQFELDKDAVEPADSSQLLDGALLSVASGPGAVVFEPRDPKKRTPRAEVRTDVLSSMHVTYGGVPLVIPTAVVTHYGVLAPAAVTVTNVSNLMIDIGLRQSEYRPVLDEFLDFVAPEAPVIAVSSENSDAREIVNQLQSIDEETVVVIELPVETMLKQAQAEHPDLTKEDFELAFVHDQAKLVAQVLINFEKLNRFIKIRFTAPVGWERIEEAVALEHSLLRNRKHNLGSDQFLTQVQSFDQPAATLANSPAETGVSVHASKDVNDNDIDFSGDNFLTLIGAPFALLVARLGQKTVDGLSKIDNQSFRVSSFRDLTDLLDLVAFEAERQFSRSA